MRLALLIVAVIACALADDVDDNFPLDLNEEFADPSDYSLPQRSGHYAETTQDPDSILCKAFLESFDYLEARSPEIQQLKRELTIKFASYEDHHKLQVSSYVEETDVVQDLLGVLKKLVEALEREYAEMVEERRKAELTTEAWTIMDQDYRPTHHEDVDILSATTEEPFSAEYQELSTVSEILAGADYVKQQEQVSSPPLLVGSVRGIPGVNFPDYTDIPLTSFSCSDKPHIPGFYADMETGCQVFHVCFKHRRESFLCPVGTTFNQPILACDYWYSSNCSLTPLYYDVNGQPPQGHDHLTKPEEVDKDLTVVGSMITNILEQEVDPLSEDWEHIFVPSSQDTRSKITKEGYESQAASIKESDLSQLLKFLPVKARVTVYPESDYEKSKVVAVASVGNTRQGHKGHRMASRRKVVMVKKEKPAPSVALKDVEATATKVISDIFKTAAEVSKKTEGVSPKVVYKPVREIVRRPVQVKAPLPLTALNKKFIVKPVDVKRPEVLHQKPKGLQKTVVKEIPHLKSNHFATVLKSEGPGLVISPLTKKTLASGYIRLLKLKCKTCNS